MRAERLLASVPWRCSRSERVCWARCVVPAPRLSKSSERAASCWAKVRAASAFMMSAREVSTCACCCTTAALYPSSWAMALSRSAWASGDRDLVVGVVDHREHVAGLDRLVVGDEHRRDEPRHLGGDGHLVGLQEGVVGRFLEAADRPPVPAVIPAGDEADQHGPGEEELAFALGGRGGRLSRGRRALRRRRFARGQRNRLGGGRARFRRFRPPDADQLQPLTVRRSLPFPQSPLNETVPFCYRGVDRGAQVVSGR